MPTLPLGKLIRNERWNPPEVDLSHQGAVCGVVDYLTPETTMDQLMDLKSWLDSAWLPDRVVAVSLLEGWRVPPHLTDRVKRVHEQLLGILR